MTWSPPGPALLFCPADRPERFAKAEAAADVVILDLEDGVNASDREAARHALTETFLDPARTIVRVNPVGSRDHMADLEALDQTPYDLVMAAKTESAAQVESLAPLRVIALCETPAGVLASAAIAASPTTVGLLWGAEDLVAALHGRSSRDGHGAYRGFARFARSQILLAAGAYGRAGIDAVHLDISDLDGLGDEARDAAESGFAATACIHPSQVATVRDAYLPAEVEVAWARGVLNEATTANGVFSYEGRMVDAPLLRQAEQVLAQFDRYRPER